MRLGDFVENLISFITLGYGKRIATYIAKLRGGTDYAVIKVTGIVDSATDNLDKIDFTYKKVAQ
jgi:hypothetical protein